MLMKGNEHITIDDEMAMKLCSNLDLADSKRDELAIRKSITGKSKFEIKLRMLLHCAAKRSLASVFGLEEHLTKYIKKIVIVNGNAQANLPPMHIAANKLANETNAAAVVVDPWDIGDAVSRELMAGAPGSMGHASQHECSQMLHLHPHLCDMSKAQARVWEQREFHFSDHYVVGNRVHFAKTPESFRKATLPTGTFGDPGHCTAEKGKVFHKTIVANIVKVIQELRETKVETRRRRFVF